MANRGSTSHEPRKLIVDLLMGTIFLIMISFSLWLVWLTYFRDYFDTGMIEDNANDSYQSVNKPSGGRFQRFHIVSDSIAEVSPSVSLCIQCHGDLPHAASREIRAFLNAHGTFMTCEVCHIKFDEEWRMVYRWLDDESGKYYEQRPVNKDFRIAPVQNTIDGKYVSLETSDERKFVKTFLEKEGKAGKSWRDAALERVHKRMSNEPVNCVDCHSHERMPLLPLTSLGYSEDRVNELNRIEVAGMVMKYKQFFLPNLLRGTKE